MNFVLIILSGLLTEKGGSMCREGGGSEFGKPREQKRSMTQLAGHVTQHRNVVREDARHLRRCRTGLPPRQSRRRRQGPSPGTARASASPPSVVGARRLAVLPPSLIGDHCVIFFSPHRLSGFGNIDIKQGGRPSKPKPVALDPRRLSDDPFLYAYCINSN